MTVRILALIKHNKFDFTFLYLKEAMRLTVQALSGNPSNSDPLKIRVKTDFTGLPTIIPHKLRLILRLWIESPGLSAYNVSVVRAVNTLLSVYRVFPTKPKVDLKSITDPLTEFCVSSLPLDKLSNAISEIIPKLEIKLNKSHLIGGETAGPNSRKSI